MGRAQYFCAASLDGFIAEPGGGLDWLHPYDGAAREVYEEFLAGVGALVMGASTYRLVMSDRSAPWPYGDRPTWVLSHHRLPAPEGADVRLVQGPVAAAAGDMRASAGTQHLWVVGGGDVASQFAGEGLLDDLLLTMVPVVLGAGIPLFAHAVPGTLRLKQSRRFGPGLILLRYEFGEEATSRRPAVP